MTQNGWLQILLFFSAVLVTVKPMGIYMARVFQRERTVLDPLLSPVERLIYKATRVDPDSEMRWTEYSVAMLLFSAASLLLTYFIERAQSLLPLNPQKLAAVAPDLAFNTAASFTTNTNWQAYTPESTMSYLTQMAGLATHNFFSAAAGMALAIAFIRGISRRESKTIGNFWVDITRATLWVLLPICLLYSVFLVSQGVVQNFHPYQQATLVEPQHVSATGADGKPTTQIVTTQTIAEGPVASQEAIKMLGTNGGGFFNANSAHPFENPTPLSNFVEMFSIFLIPAAFTAYSRSPDELTAAWMGCLCRNGRAVFCGRHGGLLRRVETQPPLSWRRPARFSVAGRRQHGGQGSAVRHHEFSALRHSDNGRELRCCELHARQLYASGWPGSPYKHSAWRNHLRRRRGWNVRHADLCHTRGLHRRPDGGANA